MDKMSYKDMITLAIQSLKQRNGSSRKAIQTFIISSKEIPISEISKSHFNSAIRKGITDGIFAQPKGAAGPVKLIKSSTTAATTAKGKGKPAAKKASSAAAKPKAKTVTKKKSASAKAPKKAVGSKKSVKVVKVSKPVKKSAAAAKSGKKSATAKKGKK